MKTQNPPPNLRLGLCCQFSTQPIKFRATTAALLARFPRKTQLAQLAGIAMDNAASLHAALEFCAANRIGSFRVTSAILPRKTHPTVGYTLEQLPGSDEILSAFRRCRAFARAHHIRTGFHPDQFVVLNSPDPNVVSRSIADIESQAEIAKWIGADTINIHGGGAYGDKPTALEAFRRNLSLLSPRARALLTVENDDKTFTPADLLPICRSENIPFVYDVHHHRCCKDKLTIEEATDAARKTWRGREPLFHLSSPINGWKNPHPERHHDYIDIADLPKPWLGFPLTVELEAKAKELAVLKFVQDVIKLQSPFPGGRTLRVRRRERRKER